MPKEALLEIDPDENVIRRVKRHPISAYMIIFVGAILFVLTFGVIFFGNKYAVEIDLQDYKGIFNLAMMGVQGLTVVFTLLALYLDRQNELIITNENIIQSLQFSLFDKQVSQLNLAKIQDVSVDQNGILANMLDFGVVEIETAGEVSNFRFIHAPQPNVVAKIIIEAHEDYAQRFSHGHNTNNN